MDRLCCRMGVCVGVKMNGCLHGLESRAFYRYTALQGSVGKVDSYKWI